ncbi:MULTISPECIES: F0F1 ATP synthase subunit delta [Thiocystis]|uniref:ATP synthase subunit delta n=1 Tax=Thiocystis violascens (strain ATCC 17096 / DSM 198 / 6111) TaxID=765911 RepID=I3YC11_THIV6|nr:MULTISPECIES: F0F1 ATP synthase subunit delta [Thiocystis]AFL74529.1 ATP synthase F1 subcomplex delta subunit [Thiocystis violascens DSM 198]MBK5962616.1 F0F1 ATP synthase subunit delta [Thiocystis minor]
MAGDITTIARPYAEAVFERAKETGQIDAWSQALELLATVTADAGLAAQIGNPSVPRERVLEIILDVCGEGLHAEAANFLRLLSRNARLTAMPEIARLFEVSRTADQGVSHVLIRSAFELGDDELESLSAALTKRFGGQVDLTVETDSALIGGIEIRAGDLVIDDSVRGKIKQLAHALQF